MKTNLVLMGAVLFALLTGCATTRVALGPVGPNPDGTAVAATAGGLQVFSRLAAQSDDQNQGSTDPIWYQHTDYSIYDLQGKLVKRVGNTIGHYEEAPRLVNLPAGQYLVKAQAADFFWVQVPVTIKSGETTRVHLDDQWTLPAYASNPEVVRMPNGKPVGWRAGSM